MPAVFFNPGGLLCIYVGDPKPRASEILSLDTFYREWLVVTWQMKVWKVGNLLDLMK